MKNCLKHLTRSSLCHFYLLIYIFVSYFIESKMIAHPDIHRMEKEIEKNELYGNLKKDSVFVSKMETLENSFKNSGKKIQFCFFNKVRKS